MRHEIKCFVFTSSIAVYGHGASPLKESDTPAPIDPYGIAKYAVELDLKAAHDQFGLNSVVFRPHNVYGEFQNLADPYRNVVGIFMNQLMQGKPLTVFGDGSQTRAFSYVGDIMPAIANCIDAPAAYNQTFNIGGSKPYSILELAQAVMAAMGKSGAIQHLAQRNEAQHAHADHARAAEVLNFAPSTSLEAGLEVMARWALQTGMRTAKPFQGIELRKGLPEGW